MLTSKEINKEHGIRKQKNIYRVWDPHLTLACDSRYATATASTLLMDTWDRLIHVLLVTEEEENRQRISFKTWKRIMKLSDRYDLYIIKTIRWHQIATTFSN